MEATLQVLLVFAVTKIFHFYITEIEKELVFAMNWLVKGSSRVMFSSFLQNHISDLNKL